jgi:hypothetical protein
MQEAKVFKDLVLGDTSKGLVHVFLAQRATSKVHMISFAVLQFCLFFFALFT